MKRVAGNGLRMLALLTSQVCWFGTAAAQLPLPASTQFDVTGFLQEATVDAPGDPMSGGTLKVNGQKITVPRNTIVILPANALTWQELFAQAPAPYGLTTTPPTTGLALNDNAAQAQAGALPAPLAAYEVHVVGNRVLPDANHTADQYIAGLVNISQLGLNTGAGFINYIDYALGELRVGGTIVRDTAGTPQLDAANPGNRIRINDPLGRFGRVMTPDGRFTVDPENPTIISSTGFPMCLPRVAPGTVNPDNTVGDTLCPEGNRPTTVIQGATVYASTFTMPDPTLIGQTLGPLPDPRIQAPLEVGDYVTWAGTLMVDSLVEPTIGPYPPVLDGTAHTYVSAFSIVDNIAIYTWPGTNPAYVMTEVTIIGTGGLTVAGAGEAAARTRFEGMTTDATRNIHLYGIDFDPTTGATTDRDWGTIGVDPGPPVGAVKGRWRFRPPCTAAIATDKACTPPPGGTFLPPTREVRAVIEGLQTQVPPGPGKLTAANGIYYGQYHAPISEYIFPENIPGAPIVENNFNTLDFLAKGGYSSSTGARAGVLTPWPSNVLPAGLACVPPVASAGGPYAVATAGTVTLAGSATGTPSAFSWAITPAGVGSLSATNVANPVYTPPASAQTVTASVTATNPCGTSTASTTITVTAFSIPVVTSIADVTVTSGVGARINISAISPGNLPLTFAVTQTVGPAPNTVPLRVTQNGDFAAIATFTHTLAPGTPAVQLKFSVVATNSVGVSSSAVTFTVTVAPIADSILITSAEYRTGKFRLDITATSNVVSPALILTLAAYTTSTGAVFTPPNGTFTNTGGGIYSISLVGVPPPACGNPTGAYATPCPTLSLAVRSSQGGVGVSALTRIRQ